MKKDQTGEEWKTVIFNFEFTNHFRLEVSSAGRVRTFNKLSDGNILKGSMTNGYRIIRLKLYKPRDEKTQSKLDYLQQQVFVLARKLKALKEAGEPVNKLRETESLLADFKKNLSKKFSDDLKKRTINHHALIHRLVAAYFLSKPAPEQTIVAHLDHDKLNNRASNLAWMTPEENYEHQKSSPHVQKEMEERKHRRKDNTKVAKLTVTKVMLLKKLLNEGKPMKHLVKLFKITDTQILRIKRGENWADIEAAR